MQNLDTYTHPDNKGTWLTQCQWGAKLALLGLCVGAVVLSAGCERRKDRMLPFDGYFFRAKVAPVDKKVSRADFTVSVRDVSQSLEGARQAGRYEATKYCIVQYGTSNVKWGVGPQTAPENLTVVDDTLTFSGRCDP